MTFILHNPSAWPKPAAYSHAVETPAGSRTVYVAGQVAIRPDGSIAEGIEEQTRQVYANIEAVLAAAGLTLAHIVKATVFLTSADDIAAFAAVRAATLAHAPASSLLVVQALAKPEFLVEIEVIAAAPARGADVGGAA